MKPSEIPVGVAHKAKVIKPISTIFENNVGQPGYLYKCPTKNYFYFLTNLLDGDGAQPDNFINLSKAFNVKYSWQVVSVDEQFELTDVAKAILEKPEKGKYIKVKTIKSLNGEPTGLEGFLYNDTNSQLHFLTKDGPNGAAPTNYENLKKELDVNRSYFISSADFEKFFCRIGHETDCLKTGINKDSSAKVVFKRINDFDWSAGQGRSARMTVDPVNTRLETPIEGIVYADTDGARYFFHNDRTYAHGFQPADFNLVRGTYEYSWKYQGHTSPRVEITDVSARVSIPVRQSPEPLTPDPLAPLSWIAYVPVSGAFKTSTAFHQSPVSVRKSKKISKIVVV